MVPQHLGSSLVDMRADEKFFCCDEARKVCKLCRRAEPRWKAFAVMALLAMAAVPLQAEPANAAYERIVLSIQQLIQNGNLDTARAQLDQASKEYPADGGLENLLGVVEVQQGHTDAAIRDFSRAIVHSPKLTSAYLNLGRAYLKTNQSDKSAQVKALHVYERALAVAPSNAEANYQAAVLLMLSKSFAPSLEHLAKLDSPNRGLPGALAVECADQAALGRREEAAHAAAALAAHPDLTEADAMEVLPVLRSAHRLDLGVLIIQAAGKRAQLSPVALRELGLAQEADGQLSDARNSLEQAFAAQSTSTTLLVDLARVARAAKDLQGALGYLAHARDIEPANASLPYYFGLVSLESSLLGESRKAFAEAVRLEPGNPTYNFAMGTVSSFAQDATSALPYLQKYHELRPADPKGILALGSTYFRAKDFSAANPWLKQALAFPGTAASAHYYLGRIARQQGSLDEAADELRLSTTLKPHQADVLAELGEVYVQMRKYPEAEKALNEAIQLNPDSYAANFGLLQLYVHTGDGRREAQTKRFNDIQSKNQTQYQEMMRIIEIQPELNAEQSQR
jgi:tetratricopeptide (TPR) repeat protein